MMTFYTLWEKNKHNYLKLWLDTREKIIILDVSEMSSTHKIGDTGESTRLILTHHMVNSSLSVATTRLKFPDEKSISHILSITSGTGMSVIIRDDDPLPLSLINVLTNTMFFITSPYYFDKATWLWRAITSPDYISACVYVQLIALAITVII